MWKTGPVPLSKHRLPSEIERQRWFLPIVVATKHKAIESVPTGPHVVMSSIVDHKDYVLRESVTEDRLIKLFIYVTEPVR
jgi:hypothetical protein